MPTNKHQLVAKFIFDTSYLCVPTKLLEERHSTKIDDCNVTIVLPKLDEENEGTDAQRISKAQGRTLKNKQIVTAYHVFEVTVEVAPINPVVIPEKFFDGKKRRYDLLGKDEKQLDLIGSTSIRTAIKAYALWNRLLRWKTLSPLVGRPRFDEGYPSHGELWEVESNRFITTHNEPMEFFRGTPIQLKVWNEIGRLFSKGNEPPIFLDLYSDARFHLTNNDYRRTVVDLAVACECFLRMQIESRIPKNLPQRMSNHLSDATISKVREVFFPEILDAHERDSLKKIASTLAELFTKRNNIMHDGYVADLQKGDCDRYVKAAVALFEIKRIKKRKM